MGKYKASVGNAICDECVSGTYLDETGQDAEGDCKDCPANSGNNPAASTAESDCKCNAGTQGLDGGPNCGPCAMGKYQPEMSATQCVACVSGKYLDVTGQILETECLVCPVNSGNNLEASNDLTDCVCDAGSTGSVGGSCTLCIAGKYKIASGNVACTDCGMGTYLETQGSSAQIDCVLCGQGKYSSSTGAAFESTCQRCVPGTYLENEGNSAPSDCVACDKGTYSSASGATSGATCEDCLAGKYAASVGNTDESDCFKCATGTFSTTVGATSNDCQACPTKSNAPQASDAQTDCVCNVGSSGPDGGICTTCGIGTYKSEPGAAACDTCPSNSNAPVQSTLVTACICNAGWTGPNGGNCTQCVAGKYKIVSGKAACIDCSAGKYSTVVGASTDECLDCPDNSNAPTASNELIDCMCNAGSSGLNGDTCSLCIAGKYKALAGSETCPDCEIGTYSASVGASQVSTCLTCPANSNSPLGSPAATACTCNAGSYGPDGGTCNNCVAGTYSESSGAVNSTSCLPCAFGKYQTRVGSKSESDCIWCNANAYALMAAASCIPCQSGTVPVYDGSSASCSIHAVGVYGGGSAGVNQTTFGRFQLKYIEGIALLATVPTAAVQLSLTADTQLATRQRAFVRSSQSAPSTSFAVTVTVHRAVASQVIELVTQTAMQQYAHQNALPSVIMNSFTQSCGMGSAPTTDALECRFCDFGYYKHAIDNSSCLSCLADTFGNTIGATACLPCPSRSIASPGTTVCMCAVGAFGPNGGPCLACEEGTFKELDGNTKCTMCKEGTYGAAKGLAACVSCPPHSTSPRGSSQITDCVCAPGYETSDERHDNNGQWCVSCTTGKYKSSAGSSMCAPCEAAKFSASAASANCMTCDAGKYSLILGASSSSACSTCDFGKYATANGSTSCSPCEAAPGHVCVEGSVLKEGVACASHLFCPGGASGGTPKTIIIVGSIAALFLGGAIYVARSMTRPGVCSGCRHSLTCSNSLLQTLKLRVAVSFLAIISWLLLAVFAALALLLPETSPQGWITMVAILVLTLLVTIGSLFTLPRIFRGWINRPVCCLCQQGGNNNKVHIDIEANKSVCGSCTTRYQALHRAPGGKIAYDASAAAQLVVGVSTNLKLKSGFVRGLPTTSFRADNLPQGLAIDKETGVIEGAAVLATTSQVKVTAFNKSGEFSATLEITVHSCVPPAPMEYPSPLNTTNTVYKIVLVGHRLIPIEPTQVDADNQLDFSISPLLPSGLGLDSKTGAIAGTPTVVIGKTEFTVTVRNARGQQSAKIAFAVAEDWQGARVRPDLWTVDMCLTWFKSEIELPDDKLIPFMTVDGKHLISLDSKEVVAEQYPEVISRDQKAIASQVATLNQNAEKANIVGRDYDNIFDAFKKTLSSAPREAGKMGGKLNDLKSGEFEDAAKGLKPFLKVCSDWNEAQECSIQGMEEEVRRLTDCPECAQVQGQILKEIKRETEGKITLRLALALVQLQQARKDPKINGSLCSCKKVVREIRHEIEIMDGWFYGRKNAKKVPWPSDSVKHQWGTYGQPLCGGCKKYGLDHSTIDSDFHYIQSEASSEKTCFNGVRDRGRNNLGADGGGMRLDDFMKLKQAVETKLTRVHLLALRFYTSHSFTAINLALRDSDRETQHPLAAITMNVQGGIKQLRGLDAKGESATAEINLWRGFTDMQVSQGFKDKGGSEFAPMSTTTDPEVAVGYAVRKGMTNGSLLMKLKTSNNMQRGAELTWLSVFPGEAETLFPPLTFLQPTGKEQIMKHKGIKLTILEVTTTIP